MKRYQLTEAADRHLREIWVYSRDRWGAARADAYLQVIETALKAALATPALLRTRPELGEGIMEACLSQPKFPLSIAFERR
jgi:toxin ParE1/3/4